MIEREEILRMAEQAGIKGPAPARHGFKMYANPERLRRFAELVAAAEREACAKLCEEHIGEDRYDMFGKHLAKQCAEAIRERGEQ